MLIVTCALTAIFTSAVTYVLFKHKINGDYTKYHDILMKLARDVKVENQKTEAALHYFKYMNNTVRQNRDDLDVLLDDFRKLEQWSYHYVQYLPPKKKREVKQDEQLQSRI